MKKIFTLATLAIFLACMFVQAQNSSPWQLGFRGYYNRVDNSVLLTQSASPGELVGTAIHINIYEDSKYISGKCEFIYVKSISDVTFELKKRSFDALFTPKIGQDFYNLILSWLKTPSEKDPSNIGYNLGITTICEQGAPYGVAQIPFADFSVSASKPFIKMAILNNAQVKYELDSSSDTVKMVMVIPQ
jgi:hypothetical protein